MRNLLKYNFFDYTIRSDYITRVSFLLLLVFSVNSNAQSGHFNSFTDPSTTDLRLAQSAVSSCEVLQEVTQTEANSTSGVSTLSSQEFFDKLQKTDSNGNLLIDTEGCTESILEFVSSLCSSDSNTNQSFCRALGFTNVDGYSTGNSKSIEDGRNNSDYKSYGESALRGLELGNSNVQAQNSNNPTLSNEGSSTFSVTSGVSAAGLLISFTPIKRLKLARNLVRSNLVTSRVKPVLNGAMLILATLGIASCGDVTEPDPDPIIETPCTRGEPGYFQLTSSTGNSASNCIQLIEPPTITYLDEDGNVINTNEITNHSIKVTFKEAVGFIDATDHGNLTPENVVKMVDIKLGNIDLLDVGFGFTIEISSDETSFTLTPETNYPAGDYVVGVSNYAKKADISKIANATNRAEYLSKINAMSQSLSSFTSPVIPTSCTNNEPGYFELTNNNLTTSCIKLPQLSFTFTQDKESFSDEHSGDPTTIIRMEFDAKIVYTDGITSNSLTKPNILEMIAITNSSGVDLATVDGPIGEDQISVTESNENTVITINPPNDNRYELGQYVLSVGNYAKSDDDGAILASNNIQSYLAEISQEQPFNIETPCGREEVGYFELTYDDNTTDCIKLINPPTITYLDKEGNTVEDTSTISDHSIKVSFDERISFIDSSRYEGLTAAFARNMIELNTGGTNLLTSTFRFQMEAGVEEESSYFILTPQPSYPAGSYSVKVKNYASSLNVSKVLDATNTEDYLALINKEYSSFSTPNISTLCEENASGYFELTNDDGSKDCIRIPQVVYTFTPRGGRELIESSWDPTEVIKIYFDSEVVYLPDSGQWREITKEDILEMIEISEREYRPREDRVRLNGPIGLNLASVSHLGGKTVITINPPYEPATHFGEIFTEWVVYDVVVSNFARRSDVAKIADSSSVNSYLDDTKTFYHGDYGVVYAFNSCDVEYRPSTSSYDRYHEQHGDQEEVDRFTCDTYATGAFASLPDDVAFDGAMSDDIFGGDEQRQKFEKAEPNTRYVIDAAFIFSDTIVNNAIGDWRKKFEDNVIENTNRLFQRSGINVELRASVMSPFSEYRGYLLCDLPSFDDLFFEDERLNAGSSYGQGEQALLLEFLPIIRKDHPADIIFSVVLGTGGGAATINPFYINHHSLSRWNSRGVVRVRDHFFSSNSSGNYYSASSILAHEIGHILGLHHDVDTLLNAGADPGSFGLNGANATGFGYGYGGYLSDLPVSTIMSYSGTNQFVPVFSADKEVLVSELCEDVDIDSYVGYCRYHHNNNLSNSSIRIGGPHRGIVADSSEAAQYTIKTVSEYSDRSVAPLDLSTVSNAITAKALRAKH